MYQGLQMVCMRAGDESGAVETLLLLIGFIPAHGKIN